MMHITEDTPPDMLAGAMDLTVHLPNGRAVKMSVERCTPMMDVLMQITTAHQLQLSGYVIEALGMAPSSEYSDKILPYKPNTPIGTLDTQHIRVVQKPRTLPIPKNIPPGHQPFESTFRLKVHLPRKQLFVSRVSMNVLLEDIMRKVCDEKNLDPNKYEFRHPDNQNEVLDPKLTLEDYKITEIFVVSKGSSRLSQAFSASDIMALRKDDERKHSKSSSGGVFNLIFKRGKMSNGSGSVSSDNRSISPTHSDDSRSVTPPAIQQQLIKTSTVVAAATAPEKPKAPLRKRRPAPKPPQPKPETTTNPIKPDDVPKRHENGLTICHSRNSSDSSGYHEASILSDNANTSLPRRPQTLMNEVRMGEKLNGEHSKSTGNLATMSLQSKSTSSLAFTGRKKKAPPPPPAFKSSGSVDNLEKASPVVASPVEHREPVEPKLPEEQLMPVGRQQFATSSPPESIASSLATTLSSNIETDINLSKENSEIIENDEKDNTFLPIQNNDKTKAEAEWKYPMQNNEKTTKEEEWKFSVQNSEKIKEEKWMQNGEKVKAEGEWEYPVVPKVAEAETEWEYRLPSPPTAFRDDSPDHSHFQSNGEFGAADSVVTSPELFEKLAKHAAREAAPSEVSEEEKPVFNNKLSLENLEKRKSLVYNRELATSLKCRDEDNARTESVSSKRSSVLSELEEVITNTTAKPLSAKPVANFLQTDSNLPNFKITTYDMPKRKINIFEDDSIRSNENTVAKADAKYKAKTLARVESNAEASLPVARSGSFSAGDWSPANPVKRSKSQVAINQYKGETMHETTATNTTANGDGGLSKANSLFDVSGLQSLEVMRKIRTKLKTPSTSTDELDRTEAPPKYGPPSINLGTWSERPKSQITLKEDGDYKYKQQVVNLRVNGVQQSTAKLTQGLENGFHLRNGDEKTGECEVDGFTRVSRLSNSETINQQPAGNVIIKIGGEAKKEDFRTRFITPVGFRRPQEKPQRPHSVAFDSSFDISRVPRVHSVELKKPYKDMNRSITQITNEPETKSLNYTINNNNNKNGLSRINSFSLNNDEYTTNKNVPFAQVKLRRTDSNRNAQIVNNNNNNNSVFGNVVLRNTANRFSCGDVAPPPPPPPAMAKLAPPKSRNVPNNQPQVDPRDELLSAIRNFGGKKGLKSMKV